MLFKKKEINIQKILIVANENNDIILQYNVSLDKFESNSNIITNNLLNSINLLETGQTKKEKKITSKNIQNITIKKISITI